MIVWLKNMVSLKPGSIGAENLLNLWMSLETIAQAITRWQLLKDGNPKFETMPQGKADTPEGESVHGVSQEGIREGFWCVPIVRRECTAIVVWGFQSL